MAREGVVSEPPPTCDDSSVVAAHPGATLRCVDDAIRAHLDAAPPEEIAELERMIANRRAGLRGDVAPR